MLYSLLRYKSINISSSSFDRDASERGDSPLDEEEEKEKLVADPKDDEIEEVEIQEEDVGILNTSQTSQFPNTVVFPQTMQIQREVFILRGDFITPQDVGDFYKRAQRLPRLRIKECMQRQAVDLLPVKIMTDQSHSTMITHQERYDWQNLLNTESVALLIMQ